MKIISCNYTQSGLRQIVLSITTMHVLNTKGGNKALKKLPIPLSKNWKLLTGNGYSIQYPQNWCVDRNMNMGLSFLIYTQSPVDNKNFRENVNLSIQSLAGQNMNMDKYVQKSQDQIKSMFKNENIISSERLRINGVEYHRIRYKGVCRGYDLEFLQYYRIKGDKAYVLTLTCETIHFQKFIKTVEKMMSSFKLQEVN
ncbi:MAG TPA: PsbP-related protein [Bacteroidales bacterium]|nr:PsbP-related protein [Bacteroidales bacterium]